MTNMRINLSTHLKTRTGDTSKDARLKNAYVEIRGEQSAVRHRPSARGGVAVGSGVAQGGIGLNIGGTDYIYTVNGDVGALDTLATAGTTWASGSSYSVGDHVSYGFSDYWALTDNTNQDPTTNSDDWSTDYVPAVPFQGTYATWNELDKGASIQLYNDFLTAVLYGMVRSTIYKSSGKWYWEVLVDNDVAVTPSNLITIGVANSNAGLSQFLGLDADGWGYGESQLLWNGGATSYGAAYTNADVISVALNMDAGTVTFYKNGVSQGVAASGLSGQIYAAIGGTSVSIPTAIIATTNFGASAFAYSVPSGYNPGLYTL